MATHATGMPENVFYTNHEMLRRNHARIIKYQVQYLTPEEKEKADGNPLTIEMKALLESLDAKIVAAKIQVRPTYEGISKEDKLIAVFKDLKMPLGISGDHSRSLKDHLTLLQEKSPQDMTLDDLVMIQRDIYTVFESLWTSAALEIHCQTFPTGRIDSAIKAEGLSTMIQNLVTDTPVVSTGYLLSPSGRSTHELLRVGNYEGKDLYLGQLLYTHLGEGRATMADLIKLKPFNQLLQNVFQAATWLGWEGMMSEEERNAAIAEIPEATSTATMPRL